MLRYLRPLLHMFELWRVFIASNLHRRWYRLIAFPFRPPRDLAGVARRKLLMAALCFLGSGCFWLCMACVTLVVLTVLYEKQLFGLDIPFLILMALCMGFAFLAFATVLYLLLGMVFRRTGMVRDTHPTRP